MGTRSFLRKVTRLLLFGAAAATAMLGAPAARAAFLDQCPCAPGDRNVLARFVYPDAEPMQPAPNPGIPPAELAGRVRAELARLLEGRPVADAARSLAVFEDPAVVAKVSDPRLRAALALLVGMKAEPAVDTILGDSVVAVAFDDLPLIPFLPGHDLVPVLALTASLSGPYAGKQVILVNRRYEHERFALLAPLLVHEALHVGDLLDGRPEEVANALLGNTFVTAELLADHPELANARTELSRWLLTFVAGLLYNSKTPLEARGPEGLAPGSPLVLPGLYPVWYPASESETPGSVLLRRLLAAYGLGEEAGGAFSRDLLAAMDIDRMRQTFLSDDDLRRIGSDVLRLELDITASGEVVGTTRKGPRLLVRIETGEAVQAHAVLRRRSRILARASAELPPGARTLALRLPAGAAGKHVLTVELVDPYGNVARIRRTVRL